MSGYELLEDDIVISPTEFDFQEKNTADQHFVVENYAEETVVFRIRVSVANVFVLTAASGVIEAEHSVEIPIALKKTLPAEFAHASDMTVKLAVEFVPFGPDYESRGSKAFWSQRGADAVRKTIVCVVSRSAGHKGSIHALDAAKLGAFDGNPDRPPSSGAKQVKISPDSLEFEENKYQCEAPLFLHNPSSNAVAYRIQPSASNEYIVARGNGVIVPGSTAKIPVVLLEVPAATSAEEALAPHSSALMIDLLDVDEGYSDKVAKSVWAAGSDRAVHASVSCIARRIDRPSAGQVLVTPECLRFNEFDDPLEDQVLITNPGLHDVAYRVEASALSEFTLHGAEGVVTAGETVAVLVTLNSFPRAASQQQSRKGSVGGSSLGKLAVDLMDVDEAFDEAETASFWTRHANDVVRRSIGSEAIPGKPQAGSKHSPSASSAASKIWAQSNRSFESFSFFDADFPSADVPPAAPPAPAASRRMSSVGIPVMSVFPECLYFMEGDEPLTDTIILHNIGISNTTLADMRGMVAYRITSSTPNRFSIEDGGEMGAVQFDETAHASVTLKSFPALLASDDIPIADFYVDFTRCDESYFDVDPNVFWDLQVGDRFMRKVVSAKAIGYEERARVEGRLKAAELSEALIDYDGLSLFHNESPADPVALELSVEAAAPIAAPLVVAGSAAVASPSASVFPKCLFFLEGDEPMEDTIRIMNTSAVPIIYRVYSSVPTKFVMPLKDGVLDPDEAVNLSVKLKCFPSHPPLDDSLAKFNIEFVFYDDKYFTMDPVLFWREQGDTLLRKSVLSRAINWESREAIDTRKRSLSMAEVPTEFDGYQQMAGSATGEVRLPKQEAATSAGGSGAPEATRHSRRASLGEAVVGESDGHRERRQSMNVMLAELATTLDQGVALKKVDVSTSRRPPALSSSPTSFSSVMDEMKYFMRQASGLEEDELADNEPLKAAQQIEPAPTAVAVQDPAALADDSPTQATQRRVSWLRACELLRIMPATVYFKEEDEEMKATITLHNTALEPLIFRTRPAMPSLFVVTSGAGVLTEDERATVSVLLKAFPSETLLQSLPDPTVLANIYVDIMEFDDRYGKMGPEAYWSTYGSSCVCKLVAARVMQAVPPAIISQAIPVASIRRHSLEPKLPPPVEQPSLSRAGSFGIRDAEKVELLPLCLKFIKGDSRLVDILNFNNVSNKPVAFRIRVSVPNIFVLRTSEGVLDPNQRLSVPVVLKAFPPSAEDPLAKFAIEFLECDDSYYVMGAKSFWKLKADSSVRRTVLSKVVDSPSSPVHSPDTTELAPLAVAASSSKSFLSRRRSVTGPEPIVIEELVSREGETLCDAATLIDVDPLCLHFVEGSEVLKDTLLLSNTSKKPVAFRIRVSIPNIFVLKTSEGVLDPNERLSVPVVLKAFPAGGGSGEETPLAKFAIEFLECDDSYYVMGAKSFWKEHATRAVRSSIQSVAVRAAVEAFAEDLDAVVKVAPDCLIFNEHDELLQQNVELQNEGSSSVAFRIRVSIPNIFVLKTSEGVLDPNQRLSVPVVLKAFPPSAEDPLAKFAIEFLECDDDYYILGSKEYWKLRSDSIVSRKITCKAVIAAKDKKDAEKRVSPEEEFEVTPGCLVYKEGDDAMKDQLRLHNKSEHRQFAYRVLVSAASMFVLKKSEGVLEPTQKLSVPVVLKNFPASGVSDDEPLAKFAVEFLECDENYYLIGAKAFWKMNEGSQHCKKVISRGISKTRLSDLQKLPISETTLVSPSILYFNGQCMSDTLTVLNNGLVSVAFRILVSVPHRFSISVTDGILNPCQRMDIPVVLPVLPSEDSNSVLLAKLAVEFLPCDDDYYIVGPKAYWATNKERAFRKKITAELGQKGGEDKVASMSCLVEKSTAQSAVPVPELSEMNALRAVERVEVVPKILHFKVGDFSTENFVELYNNGKAAIAFRTRVSAQNMFVVKHGDGVLEAGDSCRIHISSKPTTAYDLTDEIPAVKFAIDLLEVDNRFHELGAKTFWQRYSPEGVRHSIVANCSFSSLKPVATRRFGSPSRVSWADESADESDKVVRSVVSPNPEKHRRHIAEMESILSDLKGQLSSDSVRTEGVEDTPEVNIEAILQIGKALLKESVDLTKEESSVSTERHRDALRFQSQPEVDTIEQPSVQPAISVASPRPLSKPRGRLFELMIKNVSRDQLLTSEEAEELKQIRELMTKEHWEEWLTDARNERKRRRAASDPAVDRQPQQIPATYHTESAKFKEAPSPKSIIKTRVLDKRSIKSINKLVKKKEADRSISVLKDALEHLWAKVVDEAGPRSTLNPPNVDISGLDNPGAAAKILLADIQAQVKKSNPADQQRLSEKIVALGVVLSSMDTKKSLDSDPQLTRTFSDDSVPKSVLSTSPAYHQIYRHDNESNYDDLGLFTPPNWKSERPAPLTSTFDTNALFGDTKTSAQLAASMPLPKTANGRSHSAPRIRPKAGTPTKTSGSSISQRIRGGQRAGRIDRWCLTIGSHLKAFDDYPIRVDTQLASVDVVWREKRYEMSGMWKISDPLSRGTAVLRRERFQFDEMFWGPSAAVRLGGSSRQRVLDALRQNVDLCFICLASGERGDETKTGGLMEPPLALLLGDQGGLGLISGVVDEMFRYLGQNLQPPAQLMPDLSSSYGRSAQSLQASGITASVIMSAVIIRDGHISDLLSSPAKEGGVPTIKRITGGRNILCNIGRLRLHSAADFERVAGVLCGRRSALKQISSAAQRSNEELDVDSTVSVDENSCMLITVSVTGFNLSGGGEQNYFFVCPCSDRWRKPGDEICMLSEAVSALPHPSPTSLIANSLLVQLMTDPNARPTDFISVTSVIRTIVQSSAETPRGTALTNEAAKDLMVQESLQALRVVTKLSLLV